MKTVGIATIHGISNFGSLLQTYATQCIVERLGYQPTIINYRYPNEYHLEQNKLHNPYASGEISLFLLGINKNWDYDYYPVGGIVIDNVAPILLWENPALQLFSVNAYPVHGALEKFKDYYVKFPVSLYQSQIKNVTWGNFEGNNYWGYPIVFTVNIAEIGDLSSVILQGKRYRIDLSEAFRKNAFVFEHRLPRLNVGDNYITIQFEDRMGNVSSGEINIRTESIRNEEM